MDRSNPAKPRDTAVAWAELIVQEFFAQGDREKSLGLPISPMCNRETTNLSATQIGFIKFIVLPTYEVRFSPQSTGRVSRVPAGIL